MQLSLVLPGECPATAVSLSAGAAGLYAKPFSISALTNAVPNALHLGFAAVPERLIDPSAKTLASIILATR
jgi:hypothetical protein